MTDEILEPPHHENDSEGTLEEAGITLSHKGNAQSLSSTREASAKAEGEALPRIRTYAADMQGAIKKRGATLSTIISAEKTAGRSKVQPASVAPSEKWKTALMALGAALLIIVGGTALVFTFIIAPNNAKIEEQKASIISPNKVLRIEYTPELLSKLGTLRAESNITLGEVTRLDIISNGAAASNAQILEAFGFPEAFRREVTDIMIGIHSFDRNQPFIILTVSAYDRSFNALLSSEDELARNFGSFFAPLGVTQNPPILSFSDGVVQNLDVRKSQSEWPILYGYPTRNTLIITTNEFTLREIMSRFSSVKP